MTERSHGDGTVGKALEVLDRVAAFGRPVRFTELLEQSRFPKATLYRFVQTLTNQGMLTYDPDRQAYAMGIRLVRLAHAAWHQSSLAPIARPHLEALARDVGETVHLAQLDSAQVLYVDKRTSSRAIDMYSSAGKVGPAFCTGVGKVILAYLDEAILGPILDQQSYHQFTENTLTSAEALRAELPAIRQSGYGFDREEHEPGIICVAVPILTESGRALGALSVTSTVERQSLASLERLVPRIEKAARAIASVSRDWDFPDQHSSNRQVETN